MSPSTVTCQRKRSSRSCRRRRRSSCPRSGGEVFGLVALKNMLRRKVVITPGIGALIEVVGDAGLTFPPGDAEALASCLRRVLESEELVGILSARAAHCGASLFTVERMIDKHLVLYHGLLDSRESSAVRPRFQTHPAYKKEA
jgi:glycosyltransferase involved in cell wall biosynthesis